MSVSEDELNAFVDNELNTADRARILEAINRDEATRKRVADIQQTRSLLRHAYENPPHPARSKVASSWTRQVLAASILLSAGIATGWLLHSLSGHSLSGMGKVAAASTSPKGVVIQVSEADPAKWEMALINARNVRRAYGKKPIDVEIVAYGPGLRMLRNDSSVAGKLDEAFKNGVKLKACHNTMNMTHTTRDELSPDVDIVPAGVVEIMERQHDGYAYVRP